MAFPSFGINRCLGFEIAIARGMGGDLCIILFIRTCNTASESGR